MKFFILTSAFVLMTIFTSVQAQEDKTGSSTGTDSYGNTLNIGLGIGYYGYIGQTLPVVHANFEFNVARNFTLAPFITVYTYRKNYYWGNPNNPYKYYYYRQTVIPLGVKGTYYFDQFLHANSKWDFYLAASLGLAIRKTVWESGYNGETNIEHSSNGLYLDGHIGTEYHINNKIGLYLDLSSGISTFGLAVHF